MILGPNSGLQKLQLTNPSILEGENGMNGQYFSQGTIVASAIPSGQTLAETCMVILESGGFGLHSSNSQDPREATDISIL